MPKPTVAGQHPAEERNAEVGAAAVEEGVDTVVLRQELACEDVLPVQWRALAEPPDRFALACLDEANILLLQSWIAVEEHPGREKNEELDPVASEIARLDLKLNLALQLLARLMPEDHMPAPTRIRFNALGASWSAAEPVPAPGDIGLLRVRLRGVLPKVLELPAAVDEVQAGVVGVRFLEMSEDLAELIQRLAFLRHRRLVADRRKAREM